MTVNQPSGQGRRLPVVRERTHNWKRRAATVGAGLLAACMAYGVVFGHNGLTAFVRKQQEAKSLQEQMHQLQVENDRLRGHADRLQSDPGAIEHEAREALHYARPEEVILPINGPLPNGPVPAPKTAP